MFSSEDLEIKCKFEKTHSENMSADEKDRFIRSTELAVEEFQSTFDSVSASFESLKKEMEEIKAELREERLKRKKADIHKIILNQTFNF